MRGKGWRTRRNSPGSFKSRCVTLTLTLGGLWGATPSPPLFTLSFQGHRPRAPAGARHRPAPAGEAAASRPASGAKAEALGVPGPLRGPEPTRASPPAPAAPRKPRRRPAPRPASQVPGPASRVPRPGVQVPGPRSDCAAGNWPLDFLRPDPGWGRPWAGRGGPGFRLPASGLAVISSESSMDNTNRVMGREKNF